VGVHKRSIGLLGLHQQGTTRVALTGITRSRFDTDHILGVAGLFIWYNFHGTMQEKFGIFLFKVRVGVIVRNNTNVSNGNCLARIGRDRVVVVELQH